ncbi:MAG: hypothetical protein KGH78_02225 [Candidatus Micrarchaeota archaeon]|nr:hypothetical protein [Candidatus Micrarchaeota archaeon]
MGFGTKEGIKEYAGKVTGLEFIVLDLLKRGGSEGHPKRFEIDEICYWAGGERSLKTPIFETLIELKKNGFIDEEFLIGKGSAGSGGSATRFTWISSKGRELLDSINEDKKHRARALLLGLEVYMRDSHTYEQIATLEKLYLDANTMKLAFLINKRA